MAKNSEYDKTTKYFAIGFIILLVGTSLYLAMAMKKSTPPMPPVEKSPKQITITGQVTCLPRIPGLDGSMTADCVYGFLSENGEYYLLEDPSNGNTDRWFESPLYTANKVEMVGKLTQEESEEFEVVGKITLESFTVLEASPTNEPELE